MADVDQQRVTHLLGKIAEDQLLAQAAIATRDDTVFIEDNQPEVPALWVKDAPGTFGVMVGPERLLAECALHRHLLENNPSVETVELIAAAYPANA